MFCPIFTVCILIEVSKGETKGTAFATWKRFFLEQNTKRTEDVRKKDIMPRID